jgi:hypothetical protein
MTMHESARKSLYITCILLISLSKTHAQHEADYRIQANIIYRFTKYIDWPINKKAGDFIIGVNGESPLYDDLKSVSANKTVGGQRIVVVKMPQRQYRTKEFGYCV